MLLDSRTDESTCTSNSNQSFIDKLQEPLWIGVICAALVVGTLVAAIGHFAGILAGPFLIQRFGIPTLAAQLSLIITSALVNFLCRKFIVFER